MRCGDLLGTDVGAALAAHAAAADPHTQYLKGALYSGVTAEAGTYSEIFDPPLSGTPTVQAEVVGGTALQFARVTSRSTEGFTVTAYEQSVVEVLGIDVVSGSATPTNGLTIDVLVVWP